MHQALPMTWLPDSIQPCTTMVLLQTAKQTRQNIRLWLFCAIVLKCRAIRMHCQSCSALDGATVGIWGAACVEAALVGEHGAAEASTGWLATASPHLPGVAEAVCAADSACSTPVITNQETAAQQSALLVAQACGLPFRRAMNVLPSVAGTLICSGRDTCAASRNSGDMASTAPGVLRKLTTLHSTLYHCTAARLLSLALSLTSGPTECWYRGELYLIPRDRRMTQVQPAAAPAAPGGGCCCWPWPRQPLAQLSAGRPHRRTCPPACRSTGTPKGRRALKLHSLVSTEEQQDLELATGHSYRSGDLFKGEWITHLHVDGGDIVAGLYGHCVMPVQGLDVWWMVVSCGGRAPDQVPV